jgi:MFS family permease
MLRDQAALLIPAGVGQIFVQMIRSGRDTIIPLYASGMIGLNVDQVGLMMGIAAAVEMLMFPLAGWLMDNLGRKYAYLPSFGIQGVAMALVPLTGNFGGLLACTTAIGLANGLSSGGMMTLGADLAPPHARGEFLGVWRLIGDVGGTGGPAAVGFVADALALPAAALTMAASGLLATLTFAFLLPETLHRDQDPGPEAESASA